MVPQLYNLVPHVDKEWITRSKNKRSHNIIVSDDKKLELSLGPPGDHGHDHHEDKRVLVDQDHHAYFKSQKETDQRNIIWLKDTTSTTYCTSDSNTITHDQNNKCQNLSASSHREWSYGLSLPSLTFQCNSTATTSTTVHHRTQKKQPLQEHDEPILKPLYFPYSLNSNTTSTISNKPYSYIVADQKNSVHHNNKACPNITPPPPDSKFPNSSEPNLCQKRSTSNNGRGPVVGWPPIRSSRKNLGSSSSSFSRTLITNYDESDDKKQANYLKEEGINDIISNNGKSEDHMFVKVNMEGVPIGRKVDLKAYDGYQKLSYAIDQLFQGLLAAQRDFSAASESTDDQKPGDHAKAIVDSLSGNHSSINGEYTLVYEDNEGDRMLVGDVPWQMFVSTAKRLRVLKSVELSTLKIAAVTLKRHHCDSTIGDHHDHGDHNETALWIVEKCPSCMK